MSVTVTEERAITTFPALFERLAEADEIIIEQDGKPFARLFSSLAKKRVPGLGAGESVVHPRLFDPMTEEELKDWGC